MQLITYCTLSRNIFVLYSLISHILHHSLASNLENKLSKLYSFYWKIPAIIAVIRHSSIKLFLLLSGHCKAMLNKLEILIFLC